MNIWQTRGGNDNGGCVLGEVFACVFLLTPNDGCMILLILVGPGGRERSSLLRTVSYHFEVSSASPCIGFPLFSDWKG